MTLLLLPVCLFLARPAEAQSSVQLPTLFFCDGEFKTVTTTFTLDRNTITGTEAVTGTWQNDFFQVCSNFPANTVLSESVCAVPSAVVHWYVLDDSLGPRDGGVGFCNPIYLYYPKTQATFQIRAAEGLAQPIDVNIYTSTSLSTLIGTIR
ncbi:MAG TPA: hypothetical protein VNK82_09375 [Terriglobales bacterium]|nr:hypothetical protein [Terriglobales bacterium]